MFYLLAECKRELPTPKFPQDQFGIRAVNIMLYLKSAVNLLLADAGETDSLTHTEPKP